jgi:hypothetical protein
VFILVLVFLWTFATAAAVVRMLELG